MAVNNKFSIFNFQFSKTSFFLLIILLIAAFFRLWQLDKIPPGLYPDVAINGNDALDSLKTGNFKVFYPENRGREGLFFWLIAFSFSIFGASVWSIRIVAAVIGILTVLGLYLLTKELFSKLVENYSRSIALLSSFFLAISFWHTNFSRIGFRAILIPFILVFAFYFLVKGLKNKKIRDFIIAGIFFGLGFYTYISFRFALLILPAILVPFWYLYKKEGFQKKFILFTFYFLLFTFLTAFPIILYFFQNPNDFFGRAGDVSILSAKEPIKEFGKSLILHLGMFNFWGDQNWRHNFSGSPMLFWPIGILFLLGVTISFREIFRKSSYQNKNYQLLFPFSFLLFSFFIMLLPGILSFESIPHALRVIGVIPPVYILSGFGGYKIYNLLNEKIKSRSGKNFLVVLCFLFFTFLLYGEFNKYFHLWAKNPNTEGAFTKRFAVLGYFLNSLPPEIQKYVIVNESGVPVPFPDGIPMPAQTIMFIERTKYGEPRANYLLPEKLDQIIVNENTTIIVPMKYDQGLFNELSQRFPQGESQKENEIWFYKINDKNF